MRIIIARPQGFCAGVDRAVTIVEKALEVYGGESIFVYHEIVHNKHVLESFRSRGVTFVEDLECVPDKSVLIFSAHGVGKKIQLRAQEKNLIVINATCPLVTKVHTRALHNENDGREVLIIGHPNHPEVIGTLGNLSKETQVISCVEDAENVQIKNPEMLSYSTQTTLSMDDTKEIITILKRRFPKLEGPELKDICFATQNRQNAVKEIADLVDLILVIGAVNSSNSNRLREVGEAKGVPSYLIGDASEINLDWIPNEDCSIGITSGASAPENLLIDAVNFFKNRFNASCKEVGSVTENVKFHLPKIQYDNANQTA